MASKGLPKSIQDLFPHVQKPSRYLGREVNCIVKDARKVELKFALAFPDLYDIGTSHFGLQIIYDLLNGRQDTLAERVFAPGKDMEALLRQQNISLCSLESHRAAGDFDIVGFSLLYELNYTNVLNMLDLAQIPLKWHQRSENYPMIIAGGPSVCNPEPMADFFDAMVFGDGERLVMQLVDCWMEWKDEGGEDKVRLLERWAQLEGVYVPRFFKAHYDKSGFQHLDPLEGGKAVISRAIVEDLDGACFPECPVIPFGKPIHDRLRLEISRGCTRGCRFCQAGMLYRPVRERSPESVMSLIRKGLENTGYEDLSLLSLSTGDYTCLSSLMENLIPLCREDHVSVSLPSLRAGSLTPRLMELIRSVRKTGFTIAPEAGSQRLRDVINKNITYKDVEATVRGAFELGWKVIKLYFMIGLPTERQEDLDAIVEMVQKLKQIKTNKRRPAQINVSVTTFVPKAHTPFQWAPQISLDESEQKITYLKNQLNMPGVQFKWQKPQMSLVEGILARGDRRLSALIETAWRNGATFDGWNDQFDFGNWRKALVQCGLDQNFFTVRNRELDEPLPWQHMDTRVDMNFLKDQWQAAFDQERSDDCRFGNCLGCGVCDFRGLEPRVFEKCQEIRFLDGKKDQDVEESYVWLSFAYTKLGNARFFGHLELSNIFSRAIRRARISVQYSKGFHPMPKISFDDPLPLGIESECEFMRILVDSKHPCDDLIERMNKQLPDGIRILECRLNSVAKRDKKHMVQRYCIELQDDLFDALNIQKFIDSDDWTYSRTNNKGREHIIDLKSAISKIEAESRRLLLYEIDSDSNFTIRPADIMAGIFNLPVDLLQAARVVKLDSRSWKSAVDNSSPKG